MIPTIQETKSALYRAGARDLLRTVETIKYAVRAGEPLDVLIEQLKRNCPEQFGAPRRARG